MRCQWESKPFLKNLGIYQFWPIFDSSCEVIKPGNSGSAWAIFLLKTWFVANRVEPHLIMEVDIIALLVPYQNTCFPEFLASYRIQKSSLKQKIGPCTAWVAGPKRICLLHIKLAPPPLIILVCSPIGPDQEWTLRKNSRSSWGPLCIGYHMCKSNWSDGSLSY